MMQSHSTADPNGRSPRAKYTSRSEPKRQKPSRATRSVRGLPEAVGLSFPRKTQGKKEDCKIPLEINPGRRRRTRIPGSCRVSARRCSRVYDFPGGGVAAGGRRRSPIAGCTKGRVVRAEIGWRWERADLRAPAAPRGGQGWEEREPRQKRERKKKKKNPQVSLLISRQPRYAGRARGFQREKLA